MRLYIKQEFLTLFDEFNVYDEGENTVFTVQGRLAFTKTLSVYDIHENEVGRIKRRAFSFFPTFDIEIGGREAGSIKKVFSLFSPKFEIDYMNWDVKGDFMEWDYEVHDSNGNIIAYISKELFKFTDTYCLDIENDNDVLNVLMLVLAIDAEKAERNND